jgi:agmatine/peptidylarginine deiminase
MFSREDYRLPAEWEPQSGVQLTWPHADTDWAPTLEEITATYEEMAREISKREPLLVVAPEGTPLPQMENTQRVTADTNDTWARDHGFITLVDDKGHRRLLDFCFNGWGEKFEARLDNAINRRLYDMGLVEGEYADCLDFVLEGGSIESDGQGTIFTTTGCLTAPHRNQPLTKSDIEARLMQVLCAKRVVWIEHGSLIGDDTDGHIDTLVRICPNNTIVYTGGDDDHPDLLLMEEELKTLRTLDGRAYRLLRVPLPRPIYDGDDRLPATYANFLVINGAVLVPTYGQPDLDEEACRTIGEAFADREIVAIDSRSIIRQHGSIHCCTMQFPKIGN